jgi:hypothetical protein
MEGLRLRAVTGSPESESHQASVQRHQAHWIPPHNLPI